MAKIITYLILIDCLIFFGVSPLWCFGYEVSSDTTLSRPDLAITFHVKFSSSQSTQENILEIPFRLSGNLILVEAELNHTKGFFIFDSGAPELIVNLKHLPQKKNFAKSEASGITGKIAQVRLQHIEQFKWQEYELVKAKVKTIDLGHIEKIRNEAILGLIGFDLFKKFEVQFDFKKSRLLLFKLNRAGDKLALLEGAEPSDHEAPFRMEGHIPILKIEFGEQKLNFGLDTGAELNILDIKSKKKVLQYFKIKKRGRLHGNGKNQIEVLMGEIVGMKLNGLTFPKTRAILADLRHLNRVYGAQMDGILGYHFLIHYEMSINFIKRKIYLWNPKTISSQK